MIGTSTGGQPFLVLTISSPENLAKADRYKEIAKKMADPRGLTVEQTDAMAAEGKVVVLVSLGQHSTEVASSQVGPLLVHRLATSNDERTKTILENAIFVLIPSFNPDGLVMVKDWVDKTAGTPYQGSRTPDLYHHYVGHDNNRDAYMLTQNESKLWAQVAYQEWYPQIYKDTHQTGSTGARLFLPPKTDPILPDVDPIVWRESMMLGAGMATMLEAAGVTGVETQVGQLHRLADADVPRHDAEPEHRRLSHRERQREHDLADVRALRRSWSRKIAAARNTRHRCPSPIRGRAAGGT